MIDRILRAFRFSVEYVSEFGGHASRSDATDYAMGRPIHLNMSVAPPWAKRQITRATLSIPDGEKDAA